MLIKNVQIFLPNCHFENGAVRVADGRIQEVITGSASEAAAENAGEEVFDGGGAKLIPGMIDLHFHGALGADFCDNSIDAIQTIADYELSQGVTTMAPATLTLSVDELSDILRTGAKFRDEQTAGQRGGSRLVGINMEGPFISPVKKGAQNENFIIPRSCEAARQMIEAGDGLVSFIGLAPEMPGGDSNEDFIKAVIDAGADVSLAHTNSDYDHAAAAFAAGANHAVHLYNAMPAFTHRAPGVIGAVADAPHVMAEIICDGVHIHPSAVRAAFRMLGEERMILISDSLRATGMPDGSYNLAGLDVTVRGKYATLTEGGNLAGSVTSLLGCLQTVVKEMQLPLETAVRAATYNPAKSLHIEDDCGSIEVGKRADFVLLNDELELLQVIQGGELV